jgi:hypothetical protein
LARIAFTGVKRFSQLLFWDIPTRSLASHKFIVTPPQKKAPLSAITLLSGENLLLPLVQRHAGLITLAPLFQILGRGADR